MLKKLKAVGLALVAVLAFGAIVANAAQAAEAHFTAETGTTTLTGHSAENKFVTNQGTVNCTGSFVGPVTSLTNTAQTVKATYPSCNNDLFGVEPVINMNGCDYVFHPGTYGAAGSGTSTGTVDIVCEATKKISITTLSCTITVGAQTGLSKIHYQNGTNPATGKSDVTMTAEVTGIHYEWSGPFCIGNPGTATNGTYNTRVTVTGETSKGVATGASITST